MKPKFTVTQCPTCGSEAIKRICRDVKDDWRGQIFTIPRLEFWDCPNCGEKVYDAGAMRKIEEYSPAYASRHRKRKAA